MFSLEVILICIAVSTEIFTVTLNSAIEMENTKNSLILKAAFYFTFFQLVFLLAGWFLGSAIYTFFQFMIVPMSFAIFSVIGLKIIWEAFKINPADRAFNLNKSKILVVSSLAAGFNTLIVSIGLYFIENSIPDTLVTLGVLSFLFSMAGGFLGKYRGCKYRGKWAKVIGGILLIGVGIKFLLTG